MQTRYDVAIFLPTSPFLITFLLVLGWLDGSTHPWLTQNAELGFIVDFFSELSYWLT